MKNRRPRRRPTRPRIALLPRRCAKEPARRAGGFGINLPVWSIEHVALTDGVMPRVDRRDRMTL